MASRMAGKAISPSMKRMMTGSSWREYPAAKPITIPPGEVSAMVTPPTRSEIRLP